MVQDQCISKSQVYKTKISTLPLVTRNQPKRSPKISGSESTFLNIEICHQGQIDHL